MMHLSEDTLVLHYYGEAPNRPSGGGAPLLRKDIEHHLAACDACSRAYRELTRVLETVRALPVPERPDTYEAQVWSRIRGRLDEDARLGSTFGHARLTASAKATAVRRSFMRRRKPGSTSMRAPNIRRWVPAMAAAAALVIVSFGAGRFWERKTAPVTPTTTQASSGRERVLLVAVGDHLDRSQMLLLELTNADADMSADRSRAEDLLDANRLYRHSAATTGDAGVTQVLDELELLLLDLARGPETLQASDLNTLRARIEARGLLFKVRVLASRVRDRERDLLRRASAANSQS